MKKGYDEEYVFAMFCTIDGWEYLFAEVTDEVAAVEEFDQHVRENGSKHIPFIHMQRMSTGELEKVRAGVDVLDESRNLFRVPPSMKDRVTG